MKLVIFISLFFIITGCNKPKTVLICGDHVCINKEEAEQFFEENLTIEVKVVDKKKNENIDLVQLNLKEDNVGNKKISVSSKEKTNKKIKILSNDEILFETSSNNFIASSVPCDRTGKLKRDMKRSIIFFIKPNYNVWSSKRRFNVVRSDIKT